MENSVKLFRVTLRGMTYSSTGVAYGVSYVVAKDPTEAYTKVRSFLDKEDLGFSGERALDKIELIADAYRYADVKCMLYL